MLYEARSGSAFASHINVADEVAGTFNVSVTLTVLVIPPPVTVIVAELLPRLAFAVFTLAVIVPLVEPDVGLSDNQVAPSLAVHVWLELTETVWLAGFAAPCVAVKERLLGDRVTEAAVTVRVTLTVLVVPPPITVIVPLLLPTDALLRLTFAVTVRFPDPDVGLRVSHETLLLAVQLPFDVTVTD
ncbi:MAG: hypothetical protein A4E20_14805 [Nitrospira sp. SG-bin2]|nr:MAG: hypothetical protein A4E20_14805 [Nitrospira sp. SG-bin2]